MLQINDLSYEIDSKQILNKINLSIYKGKFVGLIGPNGCGKSTLLKNIYGNLKSKSTKILLDGENIDNIERKKLAKKLSVLAQSQQIDFDFTVENIVDMGRYAHNTFFSNNKVQSKEIVDKSLTDVGMFHMKDKSFSTLSGGEKQRVLIARAFAQETDFLILDEPTNHLDIKYQIQIMDIIKSQQKTVLAVIHDMNIASSYCDYIIALKDGEIVAEGEPSEIFTSENIENIFGIKSHIIQHPTKKNPFIIYL
ncbi:MAG: ABC transporter ATP-binding protein [Cetobacterium sp.]|uniref:ABC transporter ATP-binding protein n=1 Tax=unclassified Cetobacterium TaxID=2630983 RepID=UPI00163C8061|nr:ABC transporter ATP-binding protein [Cetobacterium sp. 2A]MBC2856872.1 ABC transporter ATP-binding protein [Cetobacterium sp. 2A]